MIRQFMFATIGMFCVATGFYLLFPAAHRTMSALVTAASSIGVTGTYLTNIQTIASDVNILLGLSFVAMGMGMWLYVFLYAWRREALSTELEPEA